MLNCRSCKSDVEIIKRNGKCKKCVNLYDAALREKNHEKVKASMTKYREANREKINERARKSNSILRMNLKYELVTAYGGTCTCCGEWRIDFLTLEHLSHDGNIHRKSAKTSIKVYTDVKDSGFPKDKYTILCMNCNWASRFNGVCPHKTSFMINAKDLFVFTGDRSESSIPYVF